MLASCENGSDDGLSQGRRGATCDCHKDHVDDFFVVASLMYLHSCVSIFEI